MINTHFTALSGPLVRNEGRRGVGHPEAFATLAKRAGERGLRWGGAARRSALRRLLDAPASRRAASAYPAGRSAP